jgi:uroporphyrinogen decarboxylase
MVMTVFFLTRLCSLWKFIASSYFHGLKKIVDVCHEAGKPIILHSCGNLYEVMDEIIDYMKFDGKYSFEDKIIPVEEAHEKWGSRIAIIGGIDINYLCMSTTEEVRERTLNLLNITGNKNYAFVSGNSIPSYVPIEN